VPEVVLRHQAKRGPSGLRWTCGGVTRVRSPWRDASFGTVDSVESGPCFVANVNLESSCGQAPTPLPRARALGGRTGRGRLQGRRRRVAGDSNVGPGRGAGKGRDATRWGCFATRIRRSSYLQADRCSRVNARTTPRAQAASRSPVWRPRVAAWRGRSLERTPPRWNGSLAGARSGLDRHPHRCPRRPRR